MNPGCINSGLTGLTIPVWMVWLPLPQMKVQVSISELLCLEDTKHDYVRYSIKEEDFVFTGDKLKHIATPNDRQTGACAGFNSY